MTSVRELHNRAMDLTSRALIERNHGNSEREREFFEEALESELAAIAELDEPRGLAWSILHRSAGTLALDCRDYRQAEHIVAKALAGDPHPAIVEELRDLWERINFQRHLELRGVALQDDELQLSLAGQDVGDGVANLDDIYSRMKNSTSLIYRIVERKLKRPFRRRGPPAKQIREGFQPLVSVPRVGSFALTLKFGSRFYSNLSSLPDAGIVIEEFLYLMDLLNSYRVAEIQEIISDIQYQQNFFNLAEKIAPDGERIRQVGLTTIHSGSERSVGVTIPAEEIQSLAHDMNPVEPSSSDDTRRASESYGYQDSSTEPVEIRGTFRYADGIQGGDNIIIRVIDGGQAHTIFVPEQMMPTVMTLWNVPVVARGIRTRSGMTLKEIRPYS